MAGPTTEILNEDLKDLKREIHERYDSLREEFHGVAVELAELRGELKVTFNIARWAGALLVTTILTSGAAGLWWASGLNAKFDGLQNVMEERFKASDAKVDGLGKVMEERFKASDTKVDGLGKVMEERFKASDAKVDGLGKVMEERFKAVDERSKATDARLDRIEAALIKLLEQGRPPQPTKKAEDGTLKEAKGESPR